MAKPLNLNQARKARAKSEAQARAAENRAKFGRAKAEKLKALADAAHMRQALDGAKRDPETR